MNCDEPELHVPVEEEQILATLKELHVVYSTDGRDLVGLVVSMVSLARHVSEPGNVVISIIAPDAMMQHVDEAVRCFKKELRDELPVLPVVSALPERPCNLSDGAPTGALYQENCSQRFVRYCLQQYLPTAPRALWVDTDIVFRDDVRKLYTMRMQHPVAAALYDPYVSLREQGSWVEGFPKIGLHSQHLDPFLESQPLNAGLMVLDLTKWSSGDVTDALFRWLGALENKLCLNQLVLNIFFRSGFDLLDWRWNVMVPRRVGLPSLCLEQARALHWAGHLKHWIPDGWWMHREVAEPHYPRRCSEPGGALAEDGGVQKSE